MPKKLRKDVLDFTKGILVTSVGTGVVGSMGASLGGAGGVAATKGAAGMGQMAGYFPVMGGMIGGFAVVRMLKKAKPKKRRRR